MTKYFRDTAQERTCLFCPWLQRCQSSLETWQSGTVLTAARKHTMSAGTFPFSLDSSQAHSPENDATLTQAGPSPWFTLSINTFPDIPRDVFHRSPRAFPFLSSQDSTLSWLASVTDFPTTTASPVHARSVRDKTSGMVTHLPLSAKLSTALRGLPTFCLSSSDRTYCDFRFPITITFDFQSGPECVPRDEVSHQLTGMGGGFWLAQPNPVPSVWQSSATKASNPPNHGIAA